MRDWKFFYRLTVSSYFVQADCQDVFCLRPQNTCYDCFPASPRRISINFQTLQMMNVGRRKLKNDILIHMHAWNTLLASILQLVMYLTGFCKRTAQCHQFIFQKEKQRLQVVRSHLNSSLEPLNVAQSHFLAVLWRMTPVFLYRLLDPGNVSGNFVVVWYEWKSSSKNSVLFFAVFASIDFRFKIDLT